jgi:hypothetical protein
LSLKGCMTETRPSGHFVLRNWYVDSYTPSLASLIVVSFTVLANEGEWL